MIVVADAEFEPVLVVAALSTMSDGVDPLVKSAPHSDCKALAAVEAVLGKSPLRTLYASLTQFEQVIFDGMVEVVNAF